MKKNETFRRAEITSAGVIQFRDVTRTKPSPGEVLIEVKSCALCGSDVHSYKRKHPFVSFPCTFGHELSGVVEELGPGIEKVKIGDRVCVEPLITCGMCYYCKRVDLKPLITHRFPLEQIKEAMETKLDRSHQAIKVIINPSLR